MLGAAAVFSHFNSYYFDRVKEAFYEDRSGGRRRGRYARSVF